VLPIRRIVIADVVRAMHEETRCRDEGSSGDNAYADAIDGCADDFHEVSKIFHCHVQWPKGHFGLAVKPKPPVRARISTKNYWLVGSVAQKSVLISGAGIAGPALTYWAAASRI